eukprot:13377234-Alexandrium_andersonii.AAC.1
MGSYAWKLKRRKSGIRSARSRSRASGGRPRAPHAALATGEGRGLARRPFCAPQGLARAHAAAH